MTFDSITLECFFLFSLYSFNINNKMFLIILRNFNESLNKHRLLTNLLYRTFSNDTTKNIQQLHVNYSTDEKCKILTFVNNRNCLEEMKR